MPDSTARRQVYTAVMEHIREDIGSGRLKAGDRLESVSSMARSLGVGQSSVREAVRVLSYLGLLRVKHGGGIFVTEHGGEASPLAVAEGLPAADRGSLWDLMELRMVVEPAAARLAAQRATFEERADIRRRSEHGQETLQAGTKTSPSELQEDDNAFHAAIVRATHNPLLLGMIESVHAQLRAGRFSIPHTEQLLESSLRFHPQIAHSIMSHDPARAESFSRAHIEDAMWWLERRASAGHVRTDTDLAAGIQDILHGQKGSHVPGDAGAGGTASGLPYSISDV